MKNNWTLLHWAKEKFKKKAKKEIKSPSDFEIELVETPKPNFTKILIQKL